MENFYKKFSSSTLVLSLLLLLLMFALLLARTGSDLFASGFDIGAKVLSFRHVTGKREM